MSRAAEHGLRPGVFHGQVLVGVTYLQQNSPHELRPPGSRAPGSRLVQQIRPHHGLARFLYRTIGRSCGWSSRLSWSDTTWTEWLAHSDTELWLSWQHGRLTGFAELWLGQLPDQTATHIAYLGLLPECRSVGLGGQLVTDVTRRAWTAHQRVAWLPRVERVTVDCTDLSTPTALPNYLGRGFRIEQQTHEDHAAGTTAGYSSCS